MNTVDDRLDLLLADAEDGRPILDEGLPGEAAQSARRPRKASQGEKPDWHRKYADPNDLRLQRWGIVAPEGKDGERLLEAIAPLRRLREEEQGAPAREYRVSPEMSAQEAAAWLEDVYGAEAEDASRDERPLYLLLLGDPCQVSLELQHVLANSAFAGRVHFGDPAGEPDLDAYAAYADKIVRLARSEAREASPDLLFFVANDGSRATAVGRSKLVEPSLAAARQRLEEGRLEAASARAIDASTVSELLAKGGGTRPSVLLSVSHGAGAPRRGWRSDEEQRRRQGALVLGEGELLDAERLRERPFLPGGMWFCLACFGAGTPQESAFKVWISDLAKGGSFGGRVSSVLDSLPKQGSPPFLAAMPQAALASTAGPQVVISHIDLAWTYGFSSATNPAESRASRIREVLEAMVRGSRAGAALEVLMDSYRATNDALMSIYDRAKIAREQDKPDPTDPVRRAQLWMLRNDLRGYVLLGDPAARLPLQGHAPRAEATAPAAPRAPELAPAPSPTPEVAPPPAPVADASVVAKEAAVRALLQGDEAPRAIAARAGVPLPTLWAWFDAYAAGGRARLGG